MGVSFFPGVLQNELLLPPSADHRGKHAALLFLTSFPRLPALEWLPRVGEHLPSDLSGALSLIPSTAKTLKKNLD